MNKIVLENGVSILIKDDLENDTLTISSWGYEFDKTFSLKAIGLFHLLEHVIVDDVTKVEAFTEFNYMKFTAVNSIQYILELFYDDDCLEKLTSSSFQTYIENKFSREVFNIQNENCFRQSNNENVLNYFLFDTFNTCGDLKTFKDIKIDEFISFLRNQWEQLSPDDIIFTISENVDYKIDCIKKTFGQIKMHERIHSYFDFNPRFEVFQLYIPYINKITVLIKDIDINELWSYLWYNKNVRLERKINDVLVINLNMIRDGSEIHIDDIINGFKIEIDNIESNNSNLELCHIFYKHFNQVYDFVSAKKFYIKILNKIQTGCYILSVPIGNFDETCEDMTYKLLNSVHSRIAPHNLYSYIFIKLPFEIDQKNLDDLGEYTRSRLLCYNFSIHFNFENKCVLGTNTYNNNKLIQNLNEYFGTQLTTLTIQK